MRECSRSVPSVGEAVSYIIRRGDRNAVLEGVPTHVQDLLVEVDLVRIRLLAHPLALAWRSWAARPRAALLAVRSRARGRVDGRRDPDLLRLEGRLVRLQHHLDLLLRV